MVYGDYPKTQKQFFFICNFKPIHPFNYRKYKSLFHALTIFLMTEREYNECVNLYADNVYRFILKNLRQEEDAKDVVQTAYERLWVNRDKVEIAKAKSYLFTIAYRLMIDLIRKQKNTRLTDTFSDMAMGAGFTPHNAKRVLEEALQTLNETQRSLVMLKDYEGYNYAEIGNITGLNESQVKVYLHRARLQLKAYIVKVENVI